MKGSPYGAKGSGGYDMKPRASKNFDMSGMKNSDGSDVKPGAPGFFGNLMKGKGALGALNPLGAIGSRLGLFGKKKGGGKPPVDPNAAPPVDPNAAAGTPPVDPDMAAGPVAPPAAPVAAPVDPNAAPIQMKASPAKGKMWDALKKGKFKKAANVLKHEVKGIGAGVKEALTDNYNTRSKSNDIKAAYSYAKKSSNQADKKKA